MTNKLSAQTIVITRARGYRYHGKYPQVTVFSKDQMELDRIQTEFGGHVYAHRKGFIWVLSRRSEVIHLIAKVKPWLPSRHGFETILESHPT